MINETGLNQIIEEGIVPYFLIGSNVNYSDEHLNGGTVKSVQPFLENEVNQNNKGYSIKILTYGGINHTIEIVKGNGVNHYIQNEKDARFDLQLKFTYKA
jgi:hypothetical protein